MNRLGGAVIASVCILVTAGLLVAMDTERPQDTKTLRVSVFAYDSGRVAGKTEVWLRGAGSWFPDLRYGSDARNFPGRRVGTVDTLFFYPHGRDEPEIPVPVGITPELCSAGCARGMIHLEVWDDRYEAWGITVVDGKIVVPRDR